MQEFADQLEARQVWDRRTDEPNLWFDRFDRYRLLGATRSVMQTYVDECEATGEQAADRPGDSWYRASKEWDWADRAAAWDEHERERRRVAEYAERIEARVLRRSKLVDGIEQIDALIAKAQKADNDSEARLLLAERRAYVAELRKEHGDEVTRVEQVDPNETYDVTGMLDSYADD